MAKDIVIVGKVGAPYGVKGWSKIFSFTVPIENILDYQPWLIKKDGDWQAIDKVTGKVHNKVILVQLPGSHDREKAKTYTHSEIAIYREQLPRLTDDEYYWSDLIGLTVLNIAGEELGKVSQLTETGANDVLIVKGDREFAVPMLMDRVIKEVNLEKGFIRIDWDPIY